MVLGLGWSGFLSGFRFLPLRDHPARPVLQAPSETFGDPKYECIFLEGALLPGGLKGNQKDPPPPPFSHFLVTEPRFGASQVRRGEKKAASDIGRRLPEPKRALQQRALPMGSWTHFLRVMTTPGRTDHQVEGLGSAIRVADLPPGHVPRGVAFVRVHETSWWGAGGRGAERFRQNIGKQLSGQSSSQLVHDVCSRSSSSLAQSNIHRATCEEPADKRGIKPGTQ